MDPVVVDYSAETGEDILLRHVIRSLLAEAICVI